MKTFINLTLIFLFSTISLNCSNSKGKTNDTHFKQASAIILEEDTIFDKERYIKELALIADTNNLDRFEREIIRFKKQDSVNGIIKNEILFIGSSSFRKWKTMEQDMFPLKVLNRGFGGSTIPEIIWYADKIIFPYSPKTIVLYAGENDIANNETESKTVLKTLKLFVKMIKYNLPETKIYFVSIKPSLARSKYYEKMESTNKILKNYIKNTNNIYYIDVFSSMINADKTIKDDIFIKDKLHLNTKGYNIWKEIIKPYL